MKLAKVVHPRFHEAIMKLSNQDLPATSAKSVLEILRKVKTESETYNQERIEFLTGLATKDKKGEAKVDKEGNFVFEEKAREKVNEKLIEMMNREVELPKVKLSDLNDVKMTAQELSLLENVIL